MLVRSSDSLYHTRFCLGTVPAIALAVSNHVVERVGIDVLNREPDQNLRAAVELLQGGKMFFFAGSGISYDSNLPSAADILRYTARVLLPAMSDEQKEAITSRIQPENFYEIILGVTNKQESLHLWSSLHAGTQRKFGSEAQPNLAHFFIVEQSAKYGWPIFTTNFDCMFESAAMALDKEPLLFLPEMSPPEDKQISKRQVAICKLHGTVQDLHGVFTPQSLWTTMNQISKINTPWVNYIQHCMTRGHLCFVGYSGRDLDLFPYIKSAAVNQSGKEIFWINEFDGDYSDAASRECKATRVEHIWPSRAFNTAIRKFGVPSESISLAEQRAEITSQGQRDTNVVLLSLSNELKSKLELSLSVQQLILGLVQGRLSEFSAALNTLNNLDQGPLSDHQRGELLLACARLSHEIANYLSCRRYAKAALRLSKRMKDEGLDIRMQARCLLSEAFRMLVPHQSFAARWKKYFWYPFLLFVVCHFAVTAGLNKLSIRFSRKNLADFSIASQHELLEHSIRSSAILQGFVSSVKILSKGFWRERLLERWRDLHSRSTLAGYAAGMANTLKFSFRLDHSHGSQSESNYIYSLMTYTTGKEISVRDLADYALSEDRLEEASQLYQETTRLANASGSRLTAIKGLIGIMKVNEIRGLNPLLSASEKEMFFKLTDRFEGRLWRLYFRSLRRMLRS
jgi:hypothetical protein